MTANGLSLTRRKVARKRKPVTLIVGIVCPDGIVVASDSQTTWGSGKSWTAQKMTEMIYAYGRTLVAESGAVLTSAAVVGKLSEMANDKKLFGEHSLSELAESAVRKVRDKLRSQNFDCSSEELQQFIEANELDAELMIAQYVGIAAQIDTIKLSIGLSHRAKSFFETVGSGSDLANYLLTDLCDPKMNSREASVIAVHTVETVKRHNPYCGGPTKLGILQPPNDWSGMDIVLPPEYEKLVQSGTLLPGFFQHEPILLSRTEIDDIVKIVAEVESETRQKRGEILRDALKRASAERMDEIIDGHEDGMEELQKTHA